LGSDSLDGNDGFTAVLLSPNSLRSMHKVRLTSYRSILLANLSLQYGLVIINRLHEKNIFIILPDSREHLSVFLGF